MAEEDRREQKSKPDPERWHGAQDASGRPRADFARLYGGSREWRERSEQVADGSSESGRDAKLNTPEKK